MIEWLQKSSCRNFVVYLIKWFTCIAHNTNTSVPNTSTWSSRVFLYFELSTFIHNIYYFHIHDFSGRSGFNNILFFAFETMNTPWQKPCGHWQRNDQLLLVSATPVNTAMKWSLSGLVIWLWGHIFLIYWFIQCSLTILASDWLLTVEDRHIFHIWRHQRDVFHVWRHRLHHNGHRDRAYCNAAICSPLPDSTRDVGHFNIRPLLRAFESRFEFQHLRHTKIDTSPSQNCRMENMNINVILKK